MFPDQPNQNDAHPLEQHPSGQYQVVPPPASAPNNGRSGHNPYDFIVNPNASQKPGRMAFFGGGIAFRIAIVGVLLVVVLVVAGVVLSALGPKNPIPDIQTVAKHQQEIIRIATAAATQATSQDTLNFVSTTQLAVTSNQQQVLAYLSLHGAKMNNKLLAATHSTQTDALLANAQAAGTYNSAVVSTLTEALQAYEDLLKTTYSETPSATAKNVLQTSFSSADKLLQQANSLSATSTN